MILYLDSSAIVKVYAVEPGSQGVKAVTAEAEAAGTTVLSRAEVTAALKKACRTKALEETSAALALRRFNKDWPGLIRVRITEGLVQHAGVLAWNHDLKGYDSVHLASAAAWRQALQRDVTLATFDLALWKAAQAIGLETFPPDLPARRKLL